MLVLSHHDLGQVDRSFFAWQTEGIEVPVRQKEATAGPAVIGSLSVAATAAGCEWLGTLRKQRPCGRISVGTSLSGICQNQK